MAESFQPTLQIVEWLFRKEEKLETLLIKSLSWQEMATRINELLDKGYFASNVEIDESLSYERNRLSEAVLYMYRDIAKDYEGQYFTSLRTLVTGSFPDSAEALSEKLEDKDFRNTLVREYEDF